VQLTQVPFQGSAPAVPALVGGQVPMMFTTLGPVDGFLREGKLRVLAVADPKRSPLRPDVPTLTELATRAPRSAPGMMGPAGLPDTLVRELNRHFNEILQMPSIRERMTAMSWCRPAATPLPWAPGRRLPALRQDRRRVQDPRELKFARGAPSPRRPVRGDFVARTPAALPHNRPRLPYPSPAPPRSPSCARCSATSTFAASRPPSPSTSRPAATRWC
jgi:hypothetical protein